MSKKTDNTEHSFNLESSSSIEAENGNQLNLDYSQQVHRGGDW